MATQARASGRFAATHPRGGEELDLAIKGGTTVTSRGRGVANVYVRDGAIAEISDRDLPAAETFDASGLLVMPGMVEAHAHFMDPGDPEREDFPTASAAAAAAGVTTVIEHSHIAPVVDAGELERKAEYLSRRSLIDFGLAAHAMPGRLDAIGGVWGAGAAFLKAFTCTTHGIPGHDAGALGELFGVVAAAEGICLIHCEDEELTRSAEERLRGSGREDPGVLIEWRSAEAEQAAIESTLGLAESSGAEVVIAHVSNELALGLVDAARRRGVRAHAESCPQYMCLLEDEVHEHGAFRKFTPPARARSAQELIGMWGALASGRVSYVSSDHAPATRPQKERGTIWEVHFGLPGIDTTLPILLDGALNGWITLEDLVERYSEAPARTYGLHPRKGCLAPGADADMTIADPGGSWRIEDEDIVSKAGWSPYSGRELSGRVVRTYLRGGLVAEDRAPVVAPGVGRFVPGRGGGR